MRKIIAATNITIDGFYDHTAGVSDEEIHNHYTDLLNDADVILYGRITYELMQFWQTVLKEPSDKKSMNDFAAAIDRIPKIVFSNTLKNTDPAITGWESAELSNKTLEETVSELKQGGNGNILVGSRSLIVELANLNLIDEYQLCVHPVVIGKGLLLFDKLNERTVLKLIKTKTFAVGAVLNYYAPLNR